MLPANWNGKFVFNGVGGLAGTLNSSANPVDAAQFLARNEGLIPALESAHAVAEAIHRANRQRSSRIGHPNIEMAFGTKGDVGRDLGPLVEA